MNKEFISSYQAYLKKIETEYNTDCPKYTDWFDYDTTIDPEGGPYWFHIKELTEEEFINKIKTDDEFAKTWWIQDNDNNTEII